VRALPSPRPLAMSPRSGGSTGRLPSQGRWEVAPTLKDQLSGEIAMVTNEVAALLEARLAELMKHALGQLREDDGSDMVSTAWSSPHGGFGLDCRQATPGPSRQCRTWASDSALSAASTFFLPAAQASSPGWAPPQPSPPRTPRAFPEVLHEPRGGLHDSLCNGLNDSDVGSPLAEGDDNPDLGLDSLAEESCNTCASISEAASSPRKRVEGDQPCPSRLSLSSVGMLPPRKMSINSLWPTGKFFASESKEFTTGSADAFTKMVTSVAFEGCIAVFILLNCVTLGIQAHTMVAKEFGSQVEVALDASEQIFTVIFLIELLLRLKVHGCGAFWPSSAERRSNFMDMILVVLTGVLLSWVVPLVVLICGIDSNAEALRTVKVCRVIRLARLVRVFHRVPFFREAWQIFRGLNDSMRTLFWTVVIIFLVTYVFAVFGLFCLVVELQSVQADMIDPVDIKRIDELLIYVGGLDRLMYTLIQVLTMDSFHSISREMLVYVSWSWIYFYLYIAVACFVLMNLVTAVIVENAMSASASDHDHEVQEKERVMCKELRRLEKLFKWMDSDGGGTLNWDEFQMSFNDFQIAKTWALLDIRQDDCQEIFNLLDDGDGEIKPAEFFEGLKRMKGSASAKDVFRLQKSVDQLKDSIHALQEIGGAGPVGEANASPTAMRPD